MLPYHYYFIMLMAVLTLFLLQGRRQFDRLLSWLHAERPDIWEAAGRPIGFFWQPESGATLLEGSQARSRCFWAWMRNDPDWLPKGGNALRSTLRWSRINFFISVTGFVIAGLALLIVEIIG